MTSPGGRHFILRWTSPQVIKETHVPLTEWNYPYLHPGGPENVVVWGPVISDGGPACTHWRAVPTPSAQGRNRSCSQYPVVPLEHGHKESPKRLILQILSE
ncbi:hypothetical protein XELAEV_18037977mg [Xenopus laevis]|uniref:Uncharacterized protein n=1 Tax=Xenopus laevis TaxID=8355 RepID=A0A974CDE9_XENLA|nr:hypothetical protein XELAEV_18037977mg [Xenopus laevis]